MGFEAIVCFRGDAFVALGICHGVADSLFPVCLGFSLIVMYDAIGVRRHAGMQAEDSNCRSSNCCSRLRHARIDWAFQERGDFCFFSASFWSSGHLEEWTGAVSNGRNKRRRSSSNPTIINRDLYVNLEADEVLW
ncbi:hypothetical protein K1719_016503 [Acacia pycnantha]|nr:hypothetical protein K1719_016503 [Acacia pycnantha]